MAGGGEARGSARRARRPGGWPAGESAGACSAAQLAKSYTSCRGRHRRRRRVRRAGPPSGDGRGGDRRIAPAPPRRSGRPRPPRRANAPAGEARARASDQSGRARRRPRHTSRTRAGFSLAAQGAVDQREGEQYRGVGGIGLGQQPLTGPGGAVGLLASTVTRCPRRSQSSPVWTSRERADCHRPWTNAARAEASSASSRASSKAWAARLRPRPRGGGGGDTAGTSSRDAVGRRSRSAMN